MHSGGKSRFSLRRLNHLCYTYADSETAVRSNDSQAQQARKPVGYDRNFLDRYRPNSSSYLTEQDRTHLATVGRLQIADQPAGTYAKQILNRLLIDLAWNSSRLEGNRCNR
jgi:hypothetical protein